jgi:PleD family two-component response regulator
MKKRCSLRSSHISLVQQNRERLPRGPLKRPAATVDLLFFVHNGFPYEAHVDYLTKAGFTVSQVDGHEAVTRASAMQPDIIVLDFGCDGEVTAQLKAETSTQEIPVIALVELLSRDA